VGLRLIDEVSLVELMTVSCHHPLLRTTVEAMGGVPAWRNGMRLVCSGFAA
jgi:hypothetical protein